MIPSPTLFGDDNATWRRICPFDVPSALKGWRRTRLCGHRGRRRKEAACVCDDGYASFVRRCRTASGSADLRMKPLRNTQNL